VAEDNNEQKNSKLKIEVVVGPGLSFRAEGREPVVLEAYRAFAEMILETVKEPTRG
jgi:hypothetical protein